MSHTPTKNTFPNQKSSFYSSIVYQGVGDPTQVLWGRSGGSACLSQPLDYYFVYTFPHRVQRPLSSSWLILIKSHV